MDGCSRSGGACRCAWRWRLCTDGVDVDYWWRRCAGDLDVLTVFLATNRNYYAIRHHRLSVFISLL